MDQLLDVVINRTLPSGPYQDSIEKLARQVQAAECRSTWAVIFGGGTGLSTVLGGNSRLDEWPESPFVGLKQDFPLMDVVVCTTDDGGSTGLLLQQLPMIGIGDLRKVLLSLVTLENLRTTYGFDDAETRRFLRIIHGVFNYRFPEKSRDFRFLTDPLLAVPRRLRRHCPEPLVKMLSSLGSYVSPDGEGPTIPPGGHCLGNLLLTAAVFQAAGKTTNGPPGLDAITAGIDMVSRAIGVTPGCLHPATPTPGQLVLRYGNGVAVRGQSKSAATRRLFPIDRVSVEYSDTPKVSQSLCRVIREADLILFAPGSLYTSIMPILQSTPIVQAIRENRKALKILGANFWVQEGETDISRRGSNRGLYVSEIIEAYEQNVTGGAEGLFDVVLSANLEPITGDVVRNYALEGKSPIYLDRERVESLGVLPVEATVYSLERLKSAGVIHHDPQKFALAVRALLVAHRSLKLKREPASALPVAVRSAESSCPGSLPLCSYYNKAVALLAEKRFSPKNLETTMREIVWENRDIRPEHLGFFRGARIVPAEKWTRSKELDNVLGYYDPEDGMIKVHEQAGGEPERLRDNLLTALGESLLGRYIESRRWVNSESGVQWGARRYEIRLRPEQDRGCFLDDGDLRMYLRLARMLQSSHDPSVFGITLNDREGFLPPGLLFGLLYAWYLNNAYGRIMEYEMSLLRWSPETLIPYQLEEYTRKKALVRFFRNVVFRHQG
jgi:uncharacterized cofD-like protein